MNIFNNKIMPKYSFVFFFFSKSLYEVGFLTLTFLLDTNSS